LQISGKRLHEKTKIQRKQQQQQRQKRRHTVGGKERGMIGDEERSDGGVAAEATVPWRHRETK